MDEEKKSDFISETIVNDAIREHQRKNLRWFALGGAVFGLAALMVFGCGMAVWHQVSKNNETEETETMAETESDLPANEEELEALVSEMIQDNSKNAKAEDYSEKFRAAIRKDEKAFVTILGETGDSSVSEEEFDAGETYSGMILRMDKNGYYIITGAGKLNKADKIAVRLYDGKTIQAKFIRQDAALNIAVLRISLKTAKKHGLEIAKIGKISDLSQGDVVFWYGNASGRSASLGVGCIACIDENMKLPDVAVTGIQVCEACNAEKGSFLLGCDGYVYGLALGKDELPADYDLTDGYGVALGTEQLINHINKMFLGKKIASVGLVGQDVTDDMQTSYNMPVGMYITEVDEDSAAYDAGIQEGDILTSIDGIEITCRQDYTEAIFDLSAGQNVNAVVYRQNKDEYRKMSLKVETGAR